jgi:hypothetical protein
MVTSVVSRASIAVVILIAIGPGAMAVFRTEASEPRKVKVILLGTKGKAPDSAQAIFLTPDGKLRDTKAHVINDDGLTALLADKDELAKDGAMYINLVIDQDDKVGYETVLKAVDRIKQKASPGIKTVVVISFKELELP